MEYELSASKFVRWLWMVLMRADFAEYQRAFAGEVFPDSAVELWVSIRFEQKISDLRRLFYCDDELCDRSTGER